MLKYVPWNWLMWIEPRFLKPIPDDLKTQEMCNKAIEKVPWLFHYVPVCLRTEKMCERLLKNVYTLRDLSLTILRHKKCVKKLLKRTHISWVISHC